MNFMNIVSILAGIVSIVASIVNLITYGKTKNVKNDVLKIRQQIITNNNKYNIDNVNTFDNRTQN